MGRLSSQQRRTSTIVRDNAVHEEYNQLVAQLGELANVVSRNYIYDRIRIKTGLCVNTIAYVLNHTKSINISGDA